MRHLKLVLLALAVVGLMAPVAAAAPIEWHGGLFSLDVVSCGVDVCGADQYMVRYTADLTNFDAEIGNQANWDLYIDAIAFKVGTAPVDATVHDWSAGDATIWNPVVHTGWMSGSGLGCSSGAVSAICADATNVFAASTTTHLIYTWNFLLTMPTGVVPDVFGQPLRAEFVNAQGEHSGLLSATTTTAVPEPSSLLLLGSGLLGVCLRARRRRQ